MAPWKTPSRDDAAEESGVVLSLASVSKGFGGIQALDDVSLSVAVGTITGLIGPNGAGKTTLINCITGFYQLDSGQVFFNGADISSASVSAVAALRVGRTFQNIALPPDMTVLENVLLGTHMDSRYGYIASMFNTRSAVVAERTARASAFDALELVGLSQKAQLLLGDLPHGQQKLVELARAVVQRPRLLFLDEPGAGVSTEGKRGLADLIRAIRQHLGCTIVLVEHDMPMVMELSDEIVVLNWGGVVAQDVPEEIQRHPEVIESYLG